jgi:hypothetical protein
MLVPARASTAAVSVEKCMAEAVSVKDNEIEGERRLNERLRSCGKLARLVTGEEAACTYIDEVKRPFHVVYLLVR